mgnify:CR=1 FL=1
MFWILAIFAPPLAVLIKGTFGQFILNCFLPLLFIFPGSIHALSIVSSSYNKRRDTQLAAQVTKGFETVMTHTTSSARQQTSNMPNKPAIHQSSFTDLEKIAELKEKGIISEEEFQIKKKQILGL